MSRGALPSILPDSVQGRRERQFVVVRLADGDSTELPWRVLRQLVKDLVAQSPAFADLPNPCDLLAGCTGFSLTHSLDRSPIVPLHALSDNSFGRVTHDPPNRRENKKHANGSD